MLPIIFEKNGPIAWITFNDPDRLNALSEEMGAIMEKLIPQINRDPSIRVVILTGSGRAFSAGGHLDIIEARTKKKPAVNQKEMIRFYKRFLSVFDLKVPTIAMINGPAIGAAFAITLACDIRTASVNAKMGVNFVKLGLSPGMGSTYILPRVLGVPQAMDLLLTGRTITAEEALRRNIIHHLYAEETLKEETLKIATEIAANAPIAVRIAKQGIRAALPPLSKALTFESKGQGVTFATADLKEGVSAIRTKRPPVFSGK